MSPRIANIYMQGMRHHDAKGKYIASSFNNETVAPSIEIA